MMNDETRQRLSDLADDVRQYVAELPQETDYLDYYLVGGAIRDVALGEEPNDYDFVVVGSSDAEMLDREFRHVDASSFPVYLDEHGNEWSLARTENKVGDGYHGFEVETEGVTLAEDLRRRDLTINSLALNPNDHVDRLTGGEGEPDWAYQVGHGVLVDRHDALYDIENKQLDPVGPKFTEDPVRVLRLARYAARYPEFSYTQNAETMCRQVGYELNRVSRERIGTEIEKAMKQAKSPRRFWEVLRDVGALAVIFPELDRATLIPAGPKRFHAESADLFSEDQKS